MESGEGTSNLERPFSGLNDDSWFSQFRDASNPRMARYVYALMFFAANLLAWVVRDYGSKVFTDVESKTASSFWHWLNKYVLSLQAIIYQLLPFWHVFYHQGIFSFAANWLVILEAGFLMHLCIVMWLQN